MGKPFKIALWLSALLGSISGFVYCMIPFIPPSFLGNSWPSFTLDFEQRLRRYSHASKPTAVIIGASYAQELGESPPYLYNLSFQDNTHSENVAFIETFCRKSDIIFYVLSLRDFAYLDRKPKPATLSAMNPFWRYRSICKGAFFSLMGFPDLLERNPTKLSADDLRLLHLASSLDSFDGVYPDRLFGQISKYSKIREIDICPLKRLCGKNKNVRIVLHPIMPLRVVPETSVFASKINRVVSLQREKIEKLAASDIPFINLCTETQAGDFRDLVHMKPNRNTHLTKSLSLSHSG